MRELINIADSVGTYNEATVSLNSEEVVVQLLDGLRIEKSADKNVWTDGYLTYTITIINETNVAYKSPVVTDYIDQTIASFVEGTLTINNVALDPSQYSVLLGTLSIITPDVAPRTKTIISFKVEKV